MSKRIACLGAGRMGRGIAIVFAFSGYEVDLVDFKERSAPDFKLFEAETREELDSTLAIMSRIGLLDAEHVDRISGRITIVPVTGADVLAKASIIFEGLPEVVAVKREGLTRASELAGPSPIIASTTSTFLVDETVVRQSLIDAYDAVKLNGADPNEELDFAVQTVQELYDEYWSDK